MLYHVWYILPSFQLGSAVFRRTQLQEKKRHTITQVHIILKYRVQPCIKCGSHFVMNSSIYTDIHTYTRTHIQTYMQIIYIYVYTELYDRPNRPETLEVEPEEEVDTDEKGPYILQSEVEKAVTEIRN